MADVVGGYVDVPLSQWWPNRPNLQCAVLECWDIGGPIALY